MGQRFCRLTPTATGYLINDVGPDSADLTVEENSAGDVTIKSLTRIERYEDRYVEEVRVESASFQRVLGVLGKQRLKFQRIGDHELRLHRRDFKRLLEFLQNCSASRPSPPHPAPTPATPSRAADILPSRPARTSPHPKLATVTELTQTAPIFGSGAPCTEAESWQLFLSSACNKAARWFSGASILAESVPYYAAGNILLTDSPTSLINSVPHLRYHDRFVLYTQYARVEQQRTGDILRATLAAPASFLILDAVRSQGTAQVVLLHIPRIDIEYCRWLDVATFAPAVAAERQRFEASLLESTWADEPTIEITTDSPLTLRPPYDERMLTTYVNVARSTE